VAEKTTVGAGLGAAIGGPFGALGGGLIGYGAGKLARSPAEKKADKLKKQSKKDLRGEFGTANLKQIEKIRQREALVDAEEYGQKAELQEARLNDPRFMADKMSEARRAAVGDLARAPTGGQQAELARAALGGGDAGRVAATARQAGRGQAEATAQAAAQQGFQAGQAAAQAEQAMLTQLRQRQDALLATAGQPPLTFAEQTGQQVVSSNLLPALTEMGAGEVEAARARGRYRNMPDGQVLEDIEFADPVGGSATALS
jgi:hypothetical protein